MSRRCSSLAGSSGGKGGGSGIVPFKHSQPSSSTTVPPPMVVNQSKEGKPKWFMVTRLIDQTKGVEAFQQEIPSIPFFSSYLTLKGIKQIEALGSWMDFRFFHTENPTKFSGVYLSLQLDLSTTPTTMQIVWATMVKKVLEPDDDFAFWIDCVKELCVCKQSPVGVASERKEPTQGFIIYIKTTLTEREYGILAEDVKDFLRLSFEEHGVAFPENGFHHKFMRDMAIISN